MRGLCLILLAAAAQAGSATRKVGPAYEELPHTAIGEIARLEADFRKTLTGRRLLAETDSVPRMGAIRGLPSSEAVVYRRDPAPMIVFDTMRLLNIRPWEFELALCRELAKASMRIPVDMPEVDMAAAQTQLACALDRAESDAAFARLLRSHLKLMEAKLEGRSRSREPDTLYPPPTPGDELTRVVFYLALFERDSDQFYWAVQRDGAATPATVRLGELEDFYGRFGPRFEGSQDSPGTPWVRMSGRRYPAALLAAARSLAESGGLARIREALGGFEGRPAQELHERLHDWMHQPPSKTRWEKEEVRRP